MGNGEWEMGNGEWGMGEVLNRLMCDFDDQYGTLEIESVMAVLPDQVLLSA